MSGPTLYDMPCPNPDCSGSFHWSDWDREAPTCSECGKTATQVVVEFREAEDRELLRKFWDSLMDDGGLLYDRDQYIDTFMKERDAD